MKRISCGLAALGFIIGGPSDAQTPRPVAIRNVSVVDVETGQIRAGQTITIEGTRIRSVGDAARTTIPAGALTIDGTGRFVIPGLWDMHVHATGFGIDRLFLPMLVANGVTGVRDMFGRVAWYDSARALARRGEFVAPRIIGAGHILDGMPPIWPGSVGVNNADEARRAVDSLARDGAGFIKVYSRLTPEEFRAIAEQAKKNGLAFAGHVPTLVSVDEALTLGMQTIEHLQMFTTACSSREQELRQALTSAVASSKGWDSAGVVQRGQAEVLVQTFDPARCRSVAGRVARSNTWMVPTIVVLRSTSFLDDSTLRKDPRLEYIPGFFKSSWDPSADFRFRTVTPAGWAMRKRVFARQLEIVRVLHEAGAKFLAGTDLSNPYIYPGLSLHDELAWFVASGFTPLEALQSATLNPARFLNATDSLGTVKAGKVADLVVLDANPLVAIKNVGRIHAVVLNGVVVDSAGRAGILSNAKKLAAGGPTR